MFAMQSGPYFKQYIHYMHTCTVYLVTHCMYQFHGPTFEQNNVHCNRFSLEAGEHVTAMKVMLLRSQETMSGRKEYIVMGSTYICNEDSISIGKVV